ncbi:hypothetical protein WJU16_00915 [Chitinophaga pollutisoli]|uniref:PH domain-containing protein n=1 Tax=Chitinophaga pollutisoli TaxID=3133966 RepID=A0ABZ2YQ04_9BACT
MTHVTSKFNSYAYTVMLTPVFLPALGVAFVFFMSHRSILFPLFDGYVPDTTMLFYVTTVFCLVMWYFGGRKWTVRVEISDYSIRKTTFYGLGKSREWPLKELEGYVIRERHVKGYGMVEDLLVKKDGRTVLRIVQPVFRNYGALREAVTTQLKRTY